MAAPCATWLHGPPHLHHRRGHIHGGLHALLHHGRRHVHSRLDHRGHLQAGRGGGVASSTPEQPREHEQRLWCTAVMQRQPAHASMTARKCAGNAEGGVGPRASRQMSAKFAGCQRLSSLLASSKARQARRGCGLWFFACLANRRGHHATGSRPPRMLPCTLADSKKAFLPLRHTASQPLLPAGTTGRCSNARLARPASAPGLPAHTRPWRTRRRSAPRSRPASQPRQWP